MEQMNAGLPVYNEAMAVRLKGKLDAGALENALGALVSRHEILRSTIKTEGGQSIAVADENWSPKIKRVDLAQLPTDQRDAELKRLLIDEPREPFYLETTPGLRATLVGLGPEDHVFIVMMSHLICDWPSEDVLWRELAAFYRAALRGEALTLPAMPIQHGDYAAWQKRQAEEHDFSEDLAWWDENLRGSPELLELPTDRPRPSAISYRGARRRFPIEAALVSALRERSAREKVTLFEFFTAAFDSLLYRYTGSDDILVGLSLAERNQPELQGMIGFLVNLHALRVRLTGETTFREVLSRVQNGLVELYRHRAPSFDQVVGRVRAQRHLSYSPLVQVIIDWRDREAVQPMEGLEMESVLAHTATSKFDLTLILTDDGHELQLEVEYNTDLFDDERIDRMVGHYRMLLEAVAQNPDRRLADLPILTEPERRQLLVDWNQTAAEYPKDHCVHELFEEQAAKRPDAVAASFERRELTYRQVNERANQLAHQLQNVGVGPDTVVGICMDRSPEMLVGLLGILKAGGAYLPLDPGYPKERLAFMLKDSGAPVLLTQERLRDHLQVDEAKCRTLCLDTDAEAIARFPTENPRSQARPDSLAYVIYTSGSTGEPKGVELMHGGLLNLIFWHREKYQVRPDDKATHLAGVGFDASVWELWPYLSAGAAIHMPDEATRLVPEKLRDWLVAQAVTVSFVPTPLAEALVELPWPEKVALRALLTGGDRLSCQVPSSLPFPLINHYGPTESTVVATCAVVETDRHDGKAPPIGRPIANTRVYLLDPNLQPVPIGLPGELHIGGDQLARGYRHRPELTAEKFVPDPFNADPGARLYKTGDLARYLPNGEIEFLGRNDNQVKIRAFRIELGEIESVLAAHPGVQAAVVVANEDGSGEKRLVAYATVHAPKPTVGDLREHMKKQLPDYMVPAAFVILEQFPLTSNGKVDRAALPAPVEPGPSRVETAPASESEVEQTVAGIVAALLGFERIDVQANFFDLGGHSLLATQLIARVRDEFGVNLPLLKVFEAATVADLSSDIEQMLVAEIEAMSEEEIQRSLARMP
jgi:amino acid adenylation domain-containing protein